MKGRINLMDRCYEVTLSGAGTRRYLQVDGKSPEPVSLKAENCRDKIISMGNISARIQTASWKNTTFILAFGRTFALKVMDPLDQAGMDEKTGSSLARAPMPGVVVAVDMVPGDLVEKGRPIMTIESMKILTTIKAPCRGRITQIHVNTGQSFEKNALLVSLEQKGGNLIMRRLDSNIDIHSQEFRAYERHNRGLVMELRRRQHKARFKRPDKDITRLRNQNKMLVRERIELLLDPGTPFLELSTLAAGMAYEGTVPGAGLVSGIGIVCGREVLVMANDSTIKGGAWYPLTIKKMVRTLDIAIDSHIPVVHLVDAAGAFLPLQSEIFPDKYMGGRIFRNQCILSGMGIKQVALVLGHSTAGGAYIPTLCDFSVMVRKTGGVFLGGPPLVKAATGEDVSADELGGADVHSAISGTADYAVDSEKQGIALVREIIGTFPRPRKAEIEKRETEAPCYPPEELYGIIPDDIKKQFDMREVIARIFDGSRFHEFKPDYGTTAVCGFAFLYGWKVGIISNNGVLFSESAKKCTQFMQIANRDRIPMIFLQNITGFMVGKNYEHGGITKDGAKMLMVQSNLDVPKLTVITNGSFGAGNYAMCGRAYDARFLFIWPNSQISVMGKEQAEKTLTQIRLKALERQGKIISQEEIEEICQGITLDYLQKSGAYYSTSELWDDGIIDPADTRKALGMALSASLNREFSLSPQGILRI